VKLRQPVAMAPQRMPRVEDFPPVVKAMVDAKSRPADHENSGPMGLLKRLTNGLPVARKTCTAAAGAAA